MALSNLIKSSTGLFDTAKDASKTAGLSSSPLSPLSNKVLGSNPDQAKMAGTPVQKTSAIKDTAETLSLRDTIRKQQVETDKTKEEEEKAKMAEAGKQATGALEDRVQQLATKVMTGQPGAAIAKPTISLDTIQKAGIDPTIADDLNKLAAGTGGDPVKVAKALGIAPPGSDKASQDTFKLALDTKVKQLAPDQATAEEISKAVADSVTNYESVTLADLWANDPQGAEQTLGNLGDLARAIGMEPSEVGKLNLSALKRKLEETGMESFSEVKELQRRAADPYTSEAERNSIIRELRRLGASGVRGTEEEYSKLDEAVKRGEEVSFNGKKMSLEEALADTTISAAVASYLGGDDKFRSDFSKSNPELASLIERNKAVFTEATSKLSSSIQEVANKAAELAGKATITGADGQNYTLTNNTMKALVPEFGQYGASISPESQTILENMTKVPASFIQYLDGELSSGNIKPDDAKWLMSQEPVLINKFITNPNEMRDWYNFSRSIEKTGPIASLGFNWDNPASVGDLQQQVGDYWTQVAKAPEATNWQMAQIMQAIDPNMDGGVGDGGIEETNRRLSEVLTRVAKDEAISGLGDGRFHTPKELWAVIRGNLAQAAQEADAKKAVARANEIEEAKAKDVELAPFRDELNKAPSAETIAEAVAARNEKAKEEATAIQEKATKGLPVPDQAAVMESMLTKVEGEDLINPKTGKKYTPQQLADKRKQEAKKKFWEDRKQKARNKKLEDEVKVGGHQGRVAIDI